jgi:hypothetical protein
VGRVEQLAILRLHQHNWRKPKAASRLVRMRSNATVDIKS